MRGEAVPVDGQSYLYTLEYGDEYKLCEDDMGGKGGAFSKGQSAPRVLLTDVSNADQRRTILSPRTPDDGDLPEGALHIIIGEQPTRLQSLNRHVRVWNAVERREGRRACPQAHVLPHQQRRMEEGAR